MAEKAIKMEHQKTKKLSVLTKLGYGIGTLCDSTAANLYNIFFLVFAINFVGLNPAFAGMISAIAVLWDAITDPIVGYLSDRLKKKGKLNRRGFLIRAIGPFTVSFYFLYKIIEASASVQNIYYLVLALLFWTSYTLFMIPYSALGAEMTNDYEERTSLRLYAHIFTMLGLIVASSLTMVIVEGVLQTGGTPAAAWGKVALIYAAIIFTAGLITVVATAKSEVETVSEEAQVKNIFKSMFELLKVKSLRIIALSLVLYAIGFTIAQGTVVFLMEHVTGLDGAGIGMYFLLTAVIGIVCIPLVNFFSKKLGKRQAYTAMITFAAFGQIAFNFIGVPTFGLLLIFGVIQGIGHNVFFPLGYALTYDCCDISAYIYNDRKDATILSLTGLCQKGGYAIGTSIAGFLLGAYGYNAAEHVQSAQTISGIQTTMFIIAPIFFLAGGLVMSRFKINQKRYDALQEALEAQNNNKPHNSEGFKELL
ncbi:MFS transporter [Acidaminobacter sp. JC074]|uniref:MFS transporter n=1 Tax=Acidaminobacter sp. JC074 TaxID=2530199 RepID=UPI001F10F065|nr:MFS transporter [Acidaminobacter sp. JC074]MCH4886062.1 MFS transporter [Acidaminobacter sp. JC074]